MSPDPGYWVVNFKAFAFETQPDAEEFMEALIDAFCAMPEAEQIGSAARVEFEPEDT